MGNCRREGETILFSFHVEEIEWGSESIWKWIWTSILKTFGASLFIFFSFFHCNFTTDINTVPSLYFLAICSIYSCQHRWLCNVIVNHGMTYVNFQLSFASLQPNQMTSFVLSIEQNIEYICSASKNVCAIFQLENEIGANLIGIRLKCVEINIM